ncbi:hypothetical protein PUMCH_003714 [Australozyma saopauloensis]|uniref:Thioredoxin domain-containing protein n=1 Tax=Australozyma saopauloensis TaxID=291208 RepID=A0AAX4HD74_9ASCO|nr:hypothetical protein PUMCH_003714 [[Candida] saopauloensis]
MFSRIARISSAKQLTKSAQFRLYSFKASEQPRIRIGSVAPDWTAETTKGKISFHDFVESSKKWVVLFSHPADFTPVCTTELGAFSKLAPEFAKRNVTLLGLSTEDVDSHNAWIKDIEDVTGGPFSFPIIADPKKEIAFKYDMVSEEDFQKLSNQMVPTVRSVFVIDPSKKVRLIMTYPASTGRNSAEVLRVIDSLQLADKKGVVTPIDWTAGEDVIIPPTVSDADAKAKFGEFVTIKPYLRTTKAPQ